METCGEIRTLFQLLACEAGRKPVEIGSQQKRGNSILQTPSPRWLTEKVAGDGTTGIFFA